MFDISPLYQIMSFFIMGICCLLLIKSLRLEISTNNLIISSLLFLMPFYLENISYRYDSLTMALSCLMALCSYHLARNKPGYSWMALSLALGVFTLAHTKHSYLSLWLCQCYRLSKAIVYWKELSKRLSQDIFCFIVYHILKVCRSTIHYRAIQYYP